MTQKQKKSRLDYLAFSMDEILIELYECRAATCRQTAKEWRDSLGVLLARKIEYDTLQGVQIGN